MPTRRNEPQNKSTSHWKPADDTKLLDLVKQGRVDPEDRSLAAIKKLHAEEWPHKTYKSFARLVRPKLEKLHTARVIEGARKAQSQVEQEGKTRRFVYCFLYTLTCSSSTSHIWQRTKTAPTKNLRGKTSLLVHKTPTLTIPKFKTLKKKKPPCLPPKSHLLKKNYQKVCRQCGRGLCCLVCEEVCSKQD